MFSSIHIPWDHAGVIRTALRIYFMIALAFIAVAGDKACHLRTKLRLLQGQNVNVTNMTGWLKGMEFWKAFDAIVTASRRSVSFLFLLLFGLTVNMIECTLTLSLPESLVFS